MSKTITIIGASGKVGGKTALNLINQGHTLRLVARHKEGLNRFENIPGVEIHLGNIMDDDFLTTVLKGSDAVLLMLPADFKSPNYKIYQDELGLAQIQAIKNSGMSHVLFLSSLGGHTEENTGLVSGLARQEERLNLLDNVQVLHLRPAYFMENMLNNIHLIKSTGINGSPTEGSKPRPMIATKDVAARAAQLLSKIEWTGKKVMPLHGAKDYSMIEATKILGDAVGMPDLKYIQFSPEQAISGMISNGISESIANGMVELSLGINMGVFEFDARTEDSTTPTTLEQFVEEVFLPAYKA